MTIDVAHELDKVIASDHHDPFVVLGLHVLEHDPTSAIIRTFLPLAETVKIVINDEKRDMYRMRDEGLFEIVIPDYAEPLVYHFEATTYNNVIRHYRDPYRYLPQLSEYDRHLFNNGTHYQIYDKLGAHRIEISGVAGTIFRVWAPCARRVSVIGNFNYWDGRVHQMRVLGSSGIWELFIPDIKEGEIYKYEIRTPTNDIVEKADPFQFSAEVRPKTASIVCDLDGYAWQDDAWLAARAKTDAQAQPLSIYEVHLGSWQRDPAEPERFLTYAELTRSLIPYVKKMGFTHIELLPVMEHPLDESWGYQTTGYYSATSRYGSPRDFMHFIDVCHQNGIGVILDWIPACFPNDGHSLNRFDGTSLFEHEDPRQGVHPEWNTLLFNYGRREVENFLIACVIFWLDKYHVDGIRTDSVASMLYHDYGRHDGNWQPNYYGGKENLEAISFIKHLNSVVQERRPDVLMIAEEPTNFYGVTKPTDQGGLGFGYKWNTAWMNDTLDYFSRDPLYRKYHHNNLTFSLLYAFSERFILSFSHNEVVHGKLSLLSKMPGDRWQQFANLRLLYFFFWTHPGKKLLFMGSEFGQIGEWYCKVSLDWHLAEQEALHAQLQYYVEKINELYKGLPALWELDFHHKGFRWMDFKDVDNSIVSYARFGKDPADHVVCLLNMTPQVHYNYKLGVPELTRYEEIFSSDENSFGGSNIENADVKEAVAEPFGEAPCHIKITVPPLSGILFKPVRK